LKFKDHVSRLFERPAKSGTPLTTLLPNELISAEERNAIVRSFDIYRDRAPWLTPQNKGLSLAADIAAEMARLTLNEFSMELGHSPMATVLRRALQGFLTRLPIAVEYACAVGGIMFKPCYDGHTLSVETVLPFDFLPLSLDAAGNIRDCAFLSRKKQNGKLYLKIEEHRLTETGCQITNRAFVTDSTVTEARPCALGSVASWATLAPQTEIRGLTRPLFSYFGIPLGNAAFPASPLGVPVFHRAEELIRQADLQFGRLLWEFEGGELAVDASEDAFRLDREGKPRLPLGKERLYRTNVLDACSSSHELMKTFAPTLRDKSIINGLNRMVMFIEDACGIARGTFSDPSEIARTATEVRAMRQRTFATVSAIQVSLKRALENLIQSLSELAALYRLANGNISLSIRFGDSVLNDSISEREAERTEVSLGILSVEEFRRRWYPDRKEVVS